MSTAIAGARKSAGNSSSRLIGALKNLLDFCIRLIHGFLGSQMAAVSFREKDPKSVFNFVPVRSARSRSRAFERTQLSRIRGILCHQLRILKERFARWWIATLGRAFHLFGGGGP